MKASEKTIDQVGTLTFIGRRQTEPRFQATTAIDVSSLKEGEEAGITAYAAHTNHYDVVVECRGGEKSMSRHIQGWPYVLLDTGFDAEAVVSISHMDGLPVEQADTNSEEIFIDICQVRNIIGILAPVFGFLPGSYASCTTSFN